MTRKRRQLHPARSSSACWNVYIHFYLPGHVCTLCSRMYIYISCLGHVTVCSSTRTPNIYIIKARTPTTDLSLNGIVDLSVSIYGAFKFYSLYMGKIVTVHTIFVRTLKNLFIFIRTRNHIVITTSYQNRAYVEVSWRLRTLISGLLNFKFPFMCILCFSSVLGLRGNALERRGA